ncbi:ABC transporter ATP-binding protein [Hypericibacter adhaerens]|jgi:branched-chain amino acid transport system ATP-binding protein|uniref:ABC transporter ATP-binding protein n=1 Tax=Hypericibacter adhaerens TaxID=2602016 RepID=A0A5J6MRU5_9PROT|nr:ABC transporter ATP-binding protein [Hypericibacter adhaerens]QEX20258.1 ABC transporter ATP-binding protein [Hypericibacter adhaerens]
MNAAPGTASALSSASPFEAGLALDGFDAPVSETAGSVPAARDTAGAVLRIEGVSLAFGGVAALVDVDLEVAPREIRAVIGPNGAGKSSLINVVSGLYRPDRGRVLLAGESFAPVPTARLARLGVARTFQNLALFKGLSVIDNVVMGLTQTVRSSFLGQIFGSPRARRDEAETRARAEAIVEFLHLTAVRDKPAGTLPYGLQKRVELARALVARPKLLLLDEPLAGMTVTEKRELSGYIRNARDTYGTSIVLIEHDIGVVMGLSDRVAVLDYGRKIADGTPDEVRRDQAVIDAYLGVAHDDEAPGNVRGGV